MVTTLTGCLLQSRCVNLIQFSHAWLELIDEHDCSFDP